MILEYIRDRGFINNELVRELCGFSQKQARIILQRMRKENLIELSEKEDTLNISLRNNLTRP